MVDVLLGRCQVLLLEQLQRAVEVGLRDRVKLALGPGPELTVRRVSREAHVPDQPALV